MQGIEFEEERSLRELSANTSQDTEGRKSFMIGLLFKIGVSNKTTANFILLGIAIVFLSITFYLYAGLLGKNVPSQQDVEQIAEHIKRMQEVK